MPASEQADPVDVSVLVPVYNEARHIAETAARMCEQRLDASVEFLFVDGGSDDGTRQLLEEIERRDQRVRVLDNPARTIPVALNIGLRCARGEFIARMDAHTYYPPDYLARALERLRRGDATWVSGPALPRGFGRWSKRVELALGTWLGVGDANFRRMATDEFETYTGFTGMLRRSTLLGHGGWDEESAVNEDGELAARIRAAGGRIVCMPELRASYVPRDSLPSLARQYWRYGQYRARTSYLHPESMRISNLAAPALALALLLRLVGPRPIARLAGGGLAAYAVAVSAVTASSARRAPTGDAIALPLVFATMHIAWGMGFLVGSLRFGPPLEATALAVGLRRRPAASGSPPKTPPPAPASAAVADAP